MARTLQRKIFAGCRELGLDADARHDLQLAATGKESLSEMSEVELTLVINRLKESGFNATSRGGKGRKKAPRADIRFCHVMWRLLHENGTVRQPGAAGLNAFIRKQFEKAWGYVPVDIDTMTEWSQIRDVVEALKGWCAREQIELDQ
ncbi:regulatory protein GemA [Antarcticimicrobium sediminis]|uniref:Regulatory protein GemA n=1 Tax=Antarcticimicrobium sediminis TaxID=2546227 RepID=A0A4R5F258_9RHOB|nr:regulatory protein GemA [Antarcticimicrobium sediminis]TDE41247.1 regulatory protein GemA [Antarcticimicrobium sediminis]